MKRNPFTPIVFILFVLCIVCTTFSSCANSVDTKNNKLVREYCKKHYPKYTIRIVNKYDAKVMENRKGKKIVFVEREISYSSGKLDKRNGMYWGYIKGSNYYRTWYNSKVKKGKKVISYYIYNPHNNYCDDIVAVIDCGKIR